MQDLAILMNAVSSSNISKIGYDPEHRILEVEFGNLDYRTKGNRYRYTNISMNLWLAFYDVPSKGRFFAQYIKDKFETWKWTPSPIEGAMVWEKQEIAISKQKISNK